MGTEYIKIALIPAYEPDEKLIDVVKSVSDCGFTCFVVDDGSGKEYKHLFDAASEYAKVISYDVNRGKGCALKTGIKRIKELYEHEKYVIVTLDSDGQHTAKDSLRVCEAAIAEPDALILGSRKMEGKAPFKSRFGNAATRLAYKLSTGLAVKDTQTGLRAFTACLTDDMLSVSGERYEYEMNVLLEFSRKKTPIREVEIATIYYNGNAGTHFDPLKDSFRIYKEIIKFSASSLASFGVDYLFFTVFCVIFSGVGEIGITLSNVFARVISSMLNFTLNRKLVFKSDKGLLKSLLQYYAVAFIVLVGNTLLLKLLVNSVGINKYLAKLMTELCFFAFSFTVQRFIVFKKQKGTTEKGDISSERQ